MSRALVLSGGGFRGAVQVPVIDHLCNLHQYDAIYGTSVGALNGVMAAMGKLDELWDLWNGVDGIGGFLKICLLPIKGLYSMKPMRKKIEQHVRLKDLQCEFHAGLVSLNDGEYYNMCSSEMKRNKELWDAIQGSSCIVPMMIPISMQISGEEHVVADGGFRNIIPVPKKHEFDHVDVVSCTPLERITKRIEYSPFIFNNAGRGIEIMEDEIFDRDYKDILSSLSKEGQVVIYAPQEDPGRSFKASRSDIKRRYELGREALKHPVVLERDC
jgi:predicted acylesterase/phospholipase RssA